MSKRKIPGAIFLQWPEIEEDADDSLVSWEDVTWADQQIDETDPKYLLATPVRESAEAMLQALRLILLDLPSKRDWLDPVTEAMAREAIAAAEAGKHERT